MLLFFVIMANNNAVAQGLQKQIANSKSKFFLEGVITLDSLTKYIHKRSGIRFSFNSKKVQGTKKITFTKSNYSFFEILALIKTHTTLYYTFYAGYVIFQDNPPLQGRKSILTKKSRGVRITPIIANETRAIGEKQKDTLLQEDTARPMQETVTSATIYKLKQDTSAYKSGINLLQHQIKQYKNIIDSLLTEAPEKVTVALQPARNTILNNTDASFFSKKVKDTIIKDVSFFYKTIEKSATKKNTISLKLNYGFQWDLSMPLYGFKQYFAKITGEGQLYNLLIPKLWVSKNLNKKSELLFFIRPKHQYLTGNKAVAFTQSTLSPIDSIKIQRNTIIIKTACLHAGLQYEYDINDTWTIGGGFNFYWQYAALINLQTNRLQDGVLLVDSLYDIKKVSPDWQYVKPSFMAGSFEFLYSFKRLQIGAIIFLPVTNILQSAHSRFNPVNGHTFLRWRII